MLEINASVLIPDYNRSYRLHNNGTIWSNRCCKFLKSVDNKKTKYRLYRSKHDYDTCNIETLMEKYYPLIEYEDIQTEV